MIEAFETAPLDAEIFRLANLPHDRLQAILLRRNIPEESIDESIQSIADLGTPITLKDAVAFSFRYRDGRVPPYGSGRFHDGEQFGVYYSALDTATCSEEIKFHLINEGLQIALAFARYYYLIRSDFEGNALNLVGQEGEHPELTSADKSGYPVCQQIGSEAFAAGLDAIQTRSARNPQGICMPILVEKSISGHEIISGVRFRKVGEEVVTDMI